MSELSEQLKRFLPAAGDDLCANLKKAAQFELEWVKFLKTIFLDENTLTDEFKNAYCALGCAEEGGTTSSTTSTTTTIPDTVWTLSSAFYPGINVGIACDSSGDFILLDKSGLDGGSTRILSTPNRGGTFITEAFVNGLQPLGAEISLTRNGLTYLALLSSADGSNLGIYKGGTLNSVAETLILTPGAIGTTISDDGTKIAATIPGSVIKTSTDSGGSFTTRESVRFWGGICGSANGTILAAFVFNGGVYVSIDSGVTWTLTAAGTKDWRRLCCSADGTVIIGCEFDGRIWVSEDTGTTWVSRFPTNKRFVCVACSSDGNTIIAGGTTEHLYLSTDRGLNWVAEESQRGWTAVCCNAAGTKMAAIAAGEPRVFLYP